MGLLKGFSSGSVLFPSQITNTAAKAKTSLTKNVSSKNPNKSVKKNNNTKPGRAGAGQLRYPLEYMGVNRDYLSITVYEWKEGKGKIDPGLMRLQNKKTKEIFEVQGVPKLPEFTNTFNKNSQKSTLTRVFLPMPAMISDGTSVTWGEDSINAVAAAGVAAGSQAITDPGQARETVGKLLSGQASLAGLSEQQKEQLASWMAGKAVNSFGANINPQSLITRTTGQVLQQNLELLLTGPNLRQFSFIWNFSPRDGSEAEEVRQIIRAFKRHMAVRGGPGNGESLFIQSPDVFQLDYMHRGRSHPFLNRFKPAVLSNMDLNYTASGQYSTYNDGTPVHISMSCVFREINPIYSEDYDNPGIKGVGY